MPRSKSIIQEGTLTLIYNINISIIYCTNLLYYIKIIILRHMYTFILQEMNHVCNY